MGQLRNWRLWVPLVAIGMLVALAAGFSQLEFQKGFSLKRPSGQSIPNPPVSPLQAPDSQSSDPAKEIFILVMWGLLIVSILATLLWPQNFRQVLQRALSTAVWVAAIYFLIARFRQMNSSDNTPGTATSDQPLVDPQELLHNANQAHIPPWLIFFVIVIALSFIALGIFLMRRYWARRRGDFLEDLAGLTERAAHDLRAGGELRNIVLRCYRDMSLLLSKQKKVTIRQAMTAREFEQHLNTLGVRDDHVHQLTRLFEWVRYGRHEANETEEREAIACLEAISREYRTA
ncbi:DUF4129 domain-containing protein [Candidatus Acetothermia bacterium]|nr:DUF4129 domain-containing protein [Candidatus Acetothermia bacterium]